MAMQAALAEGELNAEINTTPLIDVMLVLLVMLIMTIPPQRHAVNIDSPRKGPDILVQSPEPIRIAIDFDGVVTWDGVIVDRAELERRLTVEASRPDQVEIHIEPHKLAQYKYVAAVMASAQRLGITRMGVIGGTS